MKKYAQNFLCLKEWLQKAWEKIFTFGIIPLYNSSQMQIFHVLCMWKFLLQCARPPFLYFILSTCWDVTALLEKEQSLSKIFILSLYYTAMKYSLYRRYPEVPEDRLKEVTWLQKFPCIYLQITGFIITQKELLTLFVFHLQPKYTKTYLNREICWLYIDSTALRHLMYIN